MRAMIMRELLSAPMNANRLSQRLGVDYKTVAHHLEVLLRMNWVTKDSDGYAGEFSATFTPEEKGIFLRISAGIGKKL